MIPAFFMPSCWQSELKKELTAPYFEELLSNLSKERACSTVLPPENKVFSAFNRTPFDAVNVVIIGQDPYHKKGQANGLSFSVNNGVRKPPSLNNIFKELKTDLGIPIPDSGNLEPWADQGVLLINATLTVREGEAGSHQKIGWEVFTDNVIKQLSAKKEGLVFLLWGNFAKSKAKFIDHEKHHVLCAAHPSPLARGAFFGCRHFSKTNELLIAKGKAPVDWKIERRKNLFD